MAKKYSIFTITISEILNGKYPIQADYGGSPAQDKIDASFPELQKEEIEKSLTWLENGQINYTFAQDFGNRIFKTLFPPRILASFRQAYTNTASTDGLRIVLLITDELRKIPWELAYDMEGGLGFLARSDKTPIVRQASNMPIPNSPPEKGQLRILIVTASPEGMAKLSVEQEAKDIVAAIEKKQGLRRAIRNVMDDIRERKSTREMLKRLLGAREFETEILHNATLKQLKAKLNNTKNNEQPYHVIHFIGHGKSDENGTGLYLEDGFYTANEFANEIGETSSSKDLILVVLNACESASIRPLFQNTSYELLQKRVTAVIGMKIKILDQAAVEFARVFYSNWASGVPIESALTSARWSLSKKSQGTASDWSIPILFMSKDSGLNINLPLPSFKWSWLLKAPWYFYGLIVALVSFLSFVFFQVPEFNKRFRTEVPVIRCLIPYAMEENSFNVVFNEFTVINENGSLDRWSNEGEELSNYLYGLFSTDYKGLNLNDVFGEGNHELRPPSHTCPIVGHTQEERASSAANLAEEINADVIIYGVIDKTTGVDQFVFEFFINDQSFQDGAEIAGPYALGGDLPLFAIDEIGGDPDHIYRVRTKILNEIVLGLFYYSSDNFDLALEFFSEAEQDKRWLNIDGKEIIYLLMGNTLVRQDSSQLSNESLATALKYYQTSFSINPSNPNFVRAKIGEASTLYLMSFEDPKNITSENIDWIVLSESEEAYQEALLFENTLDSQNIDLKVSFGLGQIYFVHWLYGETDYKDEWLLKTNSEFEEVILSYEAGNVTVANIAAHSYARVGRIKQLQGELQDAILNFEHASEIASPFYRQIYYASLGELYCTNGQTEFATIAYQDAIKFARNIDNNGARINDYSVRSSEIEQIGCP